MVVVRLAVLALLTGLVSGPVSAQERLALVIGNSNYSAIAPLKNPTADAQLIGGTLASVGFDVDVLTDANQTDIKQAIVRFGRDLRAAGPETVGLFYFAGHGIQVSGRNYLIPVDGDFRDEADLDVFAVEAEWVLRQMESVGNATNIVVLDACRNNPFARSFRSSTRGLARMDAPTGSFVAYATAPGDVALDGEGTNSPYSRALAAAITTPGLPIEQVFKAVRVDVLTETKGLQTPWDSSSLIREFYFLPSEPTLSANSSAAADEQLWERVRKSGDPQKLNAFLALYPRSKFREEALRLRSSMSPQGEHVDESTFDQKAVEGDHVPREGRNDVLANLPSPLPGPPVDTSGIGSGLNSIEPSSDSSNTAGARYDPTVAARAAEQSLGLSRGKARELQQRLTLLGYDTRGVDGIFGPGTRGGISKWQGKNELFVSGYLDQSQIDLLLSQSASLYTDWVRRPRPQPPTSEPNIRSGRYIDENGCMREANGSYVAGFMERCR